MKPVYKCDYCSTLRTEDVMRIHEEECAYNPKNKACMSCKYAKLSSGILEMCNAGVKLQLERGFALKAMSVFNCGKYENGEPRNIVGV
jgi:hypothetical protein